MGEGMETGGAASEKMNPPEKMMPGERARLRATVVRIHKLYPGPAGEVLAKYIDEWEEFGYRFDQRGLMNQLVKQVWETKLPTEDSVPKISWAAV